MFEKMDINQLQEQSMELAGAERIACMRELARRFRDGIGTDADAEEADYWDSEADHAEEALLGPRAAAPEETAPKKAAAKNAAPPNMTSWDNAALYQAYRQGNLYAAAQFAVRLSKAGETQNALNICLDLIQKLESDLSADPSGQLLPQAKLLCGKLYEQMKQFDKAQLCYEEAACELNYRPAVIHLVNYYTKVGAKRFEKELPSLLDQLSEGSAEEKLAAADGYQKLGSALTASICLQNVLSDPQATSPQRFKAMRALRSCGHLKQAELEKKMAGGDAAAFLLLAQELAENKEADQAENILSQLSAKNIPLDNYQTQIRTNITNLIAAERKRIQDEAENARIQHEAFLKRQADAERLRRQKEEAQKAREAALKLQQEQAEENRRKAEAERKRQEEDAKKARLRKLLRIPMVYIALILLGISVMLISNVVDFFTLKKIDVFEDIEVVVNGAAPYASVEVYSNSGDPFVNTIRFTATPESDLSNKDTITITANTSKKQAKAYGYRVADFTMKYKLTDVPSYISDISDLKKADVKVLFEKAVQTISDGNFKYKELQLDNGETVGISDHLAAKAENIELLDVGYTCLDQGWSTDAYIIFTMKADLPDCKYSWYGNDYYEDGLVVDYEDLYFYYIYGGLTLDGDGNLIQSGQFTVDLSNVFESKSAMEKDMRNHYNPLVKGKVKNG